MMGECLSIERKKSSGGGNYGGHFSNLSYRYVRKREDNQISFKKRLASPPSRRRKEGHSSLEGSSPLEGRKACLSSEPVERLIRHLGKELSKALFTNGVGNLLPSLSQGRSPQLPKTRK